MTKYECRDAFTMKTSSFPLIDWLLNNAPKATHLLSFTNIDGLTYEYFKVISKYNIPRGFNMGINSHHGSESLVSILSKMYHTTPEHVVTASGGSEANFLVFYGLLSTHDEVLIEQPGYQPLWLTPESIGATTKFFQRDQSKGFTIDINTLQEKLSSKTKLIVLTNPHNPTGVCLKRNTLKEISKFAAESECYVLIDEIFLDGCFTEKASAFGLTNIIITSSMTKIYGLGGLRTGWIISSEELTKKFQRAKLHTTIGASFLSEEMSAAALNNGKELLRNRFFTMAKTNFKVVKKWVDENNDIIDWVEPDGGIFCFIHYKKEKSSIELCSQLLNQHGVLVCPGSFFGLDHFFRLSYNLDSDTLRDALQRITIYLRRL